MTQTEILSFVFLVSLTFTIGQLILLLLNKREARRLTEIADATVTQREFGAARHELFVLLGDKELAADSFTFLFFYTLNTRVMRNPDKYRDLAASMREAFVREGEITETVRELMKESPSWSPRVKNMVHMNSSALELLMFRHSSVLKVVVMLFKLCVDLCRRLAPHLKMKFHAYTSREALLSVIGLISPSSKAMAESRTQLEQLIRAT